MRLGGGKGETPLKGTRVALALASGRVLISRVAAIGENGLMALELPMPSVLGPGAEVELRWSDGDRRLTLPARVVPPTPDGRLCLQGASGPRKDKTRRGARRFAVGLDARIRVEKAQGFLPGHQLRAKTVDVSLTGFAIASDEPFAKGDRLRITFFGPLGQIGPDTAGQVERVARLLGSTQTTVGVRFVDPPKPLIGELRKLLAQLG